MGVGNKLILWTFCRSFLLLVWWVSIGSLPTQRPYLVQNLIVYRLLLCLSSNSTFFIVLQIAQLLLLVTIRTLQSSTVFLSILTKIIVSFNLILTGQRRQSVYIQFATYCSCEDGPIVPGRLATLRNSWLRHLCYQVVRHSWPPPPQHRYHVRTYYNNILIVYLLIDLQVEVIVVFVQQCLFLYDFQSLRFFY